MAFATRYEIIPGGTRFAVKFLTHFQSSQEGKNTVMSPLSVEIALSILLPGAEGPTKMAMKSGLEVYNPEEYFLGSFESLGDDLKKSKQLHIASTAFFSKELRLLKSYKKNIKTIFHTNLQQLNFGDKETAVSQINEWCSKNTAGMITKMVTTQDINPSTRLILVNAIHFNALWSKKFQKELTKPDEFFTYNGVSMVQMMNSGEDWNCNYNNNHRGLNAQILQLDYKEDYYNKDTRVSKFRMVFVLPRFPDTVTDTLNRMKNVNLYDVMGTLKTGRVIVSIPKFKQEIKTNLNKVLIEMGLGSIFKQPNFGNLSDDDLIVQSVIQKAIISVAENGTEASAVSEVISTSSEGPVPGRVHRFHANHPFIYFIMPYSDALPIFQGVVMKPEFEENAHARRSA